MRIMVSGATATMRRLAARYPHNLGVLITPQNGNLMNRIPLPWACDNAAFSRPDDTRFWNMVVSAWRHIEYHPPLWIAAPDLVGHHAKTRVLFDLWVRNWEYEIGYVPAELAFVLQNGCTIREVPWDQIAAVFIGGDDRFKLREVHELVAHAKSLGKLVHIGRVNSKRRLRYAIELGADTVDGSSFSMFPDRWIEWGVRYIRESVREKSLF